MSTDGRLDAAPAALPSPAAHAAPSNGGRATYQVARPPALVGAVLPGRDRNIRKKAMRLFFEHPHLSLGDWRAAYRYVELADRLIPRLFDNLHSNGMFAASGDPRKANETLRGYMGEARAHEKDLGLTAGARASLGLTVGRMRDLASAMSEEGHDGD